MASYGGIKVSFETRLCEVNGELGYFHCWEPYSTPIEPSPMIGGHPGGMFSRVCGIVEFSDGVEKVFPEDIRFCDDQNSILNEMNEQYQRRNKDV